MPSVPPQNAFFSIDMDWNFLGVALIMALHEARQLSNSDYNKIGSWRSSLL